jgi:putative membrane protein
MFSRRGALWLWLSCAFLFVNGFFVAKVPDATRPELANVSAAFVLVLWAPSAWAMQRWLGWNRAALVLAMMGVFAVALETFAVKTGVPYGHFSYGPKIGWKVLDAVPWTVPFSWPPLVLGALYLASTQTRRTAALIAVSTLFLLAFDGVLDAGAVSQAFWKYDAGGRYYGVPLSNFLGWILSGAAGSWLLFRLSGQRDDVPAPLVSSVALILSFWTSVCLFSGLVFPAFLGVSLLSFCARVVHGSTAPKTL